MTTPKRVINYVSILLSLALMACHPTTDPIPIMTTPIQITLPLEHLVHQRDNANRAAIPVSGQAPAGSDQVRVTLTPVKGGTAEETIIVPNADGTFSGKIIGSGGAYEMSLVAKANGADVGTGRVGRVNVGEVFILYGHSVFSGGIQEEVNRFGDTRGPGAVDDRVVVATPPAGGSMPENIVDTELPRYFRPLSNSPQSIAPYQTGPYVHGLIGDKLVQQLNVPVLLLGCSFGGSNVEQSMRVIQQRPFNHSFVKYEKRMPIRPVEAAVAVYLPLTGGLRGVLMNHGANDWYNVDAERMTGPQEYADRVKVVLAYIRQITKQADLTVWQAVDNQPVPNALDLTQITKGQELVIAQIPNVRRGADMSKLQVSDRPDNVHLARSGFERYAQAWADVLTKAALDATNVPTVQGTNTPTINHLVGTLTANVYAYGPAIGLVVAVVLLVVVAWQRRSTLMWAAGGLAAVAGAVVISRAPKATA
ncbi:hypothetical protein [Fibrella forsythiae]|uniref:Sialate O-acetylesterase domain-containing protein n=1 Tax=Fibrella forsythiae TaxID=2817061 RepID=A0ABS3JC22_9BACT|nr:hypothetical protein [Fibrella forsythiae]MBO0947008.1 hypothetical protein [Fibrella forsythiae]